MMQLRTVSVLPLLALGQEFGSHNALKCSDVGEDCCSMMVPDQQPQTCKDNWVPIKTSAEDCPAPNDMGLTTCDNYQGLLSDQPKGAGCYGCFPPGSTSTNILNPVMATTCDPSTWPGLVKDCNSEQACTAVLKVRDNGGTCNVYCAAMGLACVDAWDDGNNNECSLDYKGYDATKDCAYDWSMTSDAVCECGIVPASDEKPAYNLRVEQWNAAQGNTGTDSIPDQESPSDTTTGDDSSGVADDGSGSSIIAVGVVVWSVVVGLLF